ncbi:mfs sugar [Moniliophthora roreri MCA 2997]|uniref:Mfs sugar n=1 Tax=Moniliophthora roreri (strain MCA 2997) TaxID=1381753 RepID=V2X9Q7_MONRO|nr:mfs sugar [Moniliophthora roreri MCA 2997]
MEIHSTQPNQLSEVLAISSPTKSRLRRVLRPQELPLYVWATVFTALGGFLWGYDTGSIGPISVMPQFQAQFGVLSPTVQGLLISCILITASLSSLFAGPLSDHISRTYTIAIGGAVYAAGSAIGASAMHLPQFFVGRCIAGVGEGLFISSITVYVTEISPPSGRGRLATFIQLFNTIGTMTGYFTCYGSVNVPSTLSWRLPLAIQAGVSLLLAIGVPFFPHSPRWLVHVGRHQEAEVAHKRLGMQAAEAKKNDTGVLETAPIESRRNFWKHAKELFSKDVRSRTLLGLFIMGIQQCSGIDAVLYYAPILFDQAGLSSKTASFLASGVSGILMVVLTSAAQAFQDKWTRRTPMIGGGTLVGGTMFLIGILYASHANNAAAGRWAIIVLIYLFVASYVTTWAIVGRIICSEIQPSRTRASATSLGQCANWVVNTIIAFVTPLFLARTTSGPYFFFGGCSFLCVLVCWVFQPETKGLDLDTIDKGFVETPLQSAFRRGLARRRVPNTESHKLTELPSPTLDTK